MGGAAPQPTGKGGKKPIDAAINLVPFIDLLSCCISFLLITAVWTQLARMNVNQKGQGAAGAESEKPPEPTVNLTVFINADGYIYQESTGKSKEIKKVGDEYDYEALGKTLAEAKKAYPDKSDLAVKSDDTVPYDKVIRTIDTVISCGGPKPSTDEDRCFPDVALSDKGQGG